MEQPLKANFFPGILEGLAGRLSLMPPGVTDPPTSVRAGCQRDRGKRYQPQANHAYRGASRAPSGLWPGFPNQEG